MRLNLLNECIYSYFYFCIDGLAPKFDTVSSSWLLLSKLIKMFSGLILSKNQAGVAIAFFDLQLWGQVIYR